MPEMFPTCGQNPGIVVSLELNLTSLLRSTVAKDTSNRVKFQGMVSADTKRFLEIAWREGKDPTLLTWNDLAEFCVEMGHRELVKMNKSEHGLYVVSMLEKKRKKDAEEALKRIEYEVDGWTPREELWRGITPIRKVDGG